MSAFDDRVFVASVVFAVCLLQSPRRRGESGPRDKERERVRDFSFFHFHGTGALEGYTRKQIRDRNLGEREGGGGGV